MGELMNGQGDFIKGRCKVCSEVTRHTILSMQNQKPKLVRCNHCEDQHRYKAPPPTKVERARATAARQQVKQREADCQRWKQLRPKMVEKTAKDYSMEGLFRKKDIIRHPVFGFGLVEKKLGPHKVEVLFEDGRKVMRCQG